MRATSWLKTIILALALGPDNAESQESGVWEFLSSEGVVEHRPQPEWQVLDLDTRDLPRPIAIESEIWGSGPGKIVEVEPIVSEGAGGQSFDGNFDRPISRIVEGPDGHVWVADRQGLCRYDGQTWTIYTEADGFHIDLVNGMEFDLGGTLWISGSNGITQFDGSKWMWYALGREVSRSMAVGPNGDVWTGGGVVVDMNREQVEIIGSVLYRFDGQNWWEYSGDAGLPIGEGARIDDIDVDQSGTVWAHLTSIVISFDGSEVTVYWTPIGLNSLFVDSKDQIWVGVRDRLLVKDGLSWSEFPTDEAGNWAGILIIYEDIFSRLWFGGGSSWGLLDGTKGSFHVYEELNATARAFLVDKRGINWVGLSNGENRLFRWRPNVLPTNIQEESSSPLPERLRLATNFPNPFNSSTQIHFTLPNVGTVQLQIYNLAGQLVATLLDAALPAGPHQIAWNGRDDQGRAVASGIYIYRLQQQGQVLLRKMVLLR